MSTNPEQQLTETIDQRDKAESWADTLANAIAAHFGADIGEHSSANCPWEEALAVIESAPSHQQLELGTQALRAAVKGWEARANDLQKQIDVREALACDSTPVSAAVATLVQALRSDAELAWTWHCNIAMAAVDEGVGHARANHAAARFMRQLAGVDPAHELPEKLEEPAPQPDRKSLCAALLQAAHAFWSSEREHGQLGAVKWVQGKQGELVIFTRGEYREKLMASVGGDEDTPHRLEAEPLPEREPLTLDMVRALPTIKAPEIDGEESDGTPRYWRSRPYVSLTRLERLLLAHGLGNMGGAPQAETSAKEPIPGWVAEDWLAARPELANSCTCPSGDGSLRWPCPAHPQGVAAGYALVPVKPTDAMSIAGGIAWERSAAHDILGPLGDAWAAMLAAAPRQTEGVAAPIAAQPAPSFRTSKSGRDQVARFFSEHLKRHDFTRYISDTLAADFACALAPVLYAVQSTAPEAAPAPQPVREPLSAPRREELWQQHWPQGQGWGARAWHQQGIEDAEGAHGITKEGNQP